MHMAGSSPSWGRVALQSCDTGPCSLSPPALALHPQLPASPLPALQFHPLSWGAASTHSPSHTTRCDQGAPAHAQLNAHREYNAQVLSAGCGGRVGDQLLLCISPSPSAIVQGHPRLSLTRVSPLGGISGSIMGQRGT
ncbi:hypothetical protein KIL84_011472 [Mauremys mutica]|uniref:Uncharacterized protein n=1 Tax=Mauremys mutica TaxID=74926 RepID=A0A9D3XEV7_9SAUR|nr:hypothetical protein KIL84_011472 [Mauremys mutica]